MTTKQRQLEQAFFRKLNSVVEPAVRRGIFSSRFLPTTLMVLESTGHLTGKQRRTPLFCNRLGPYMLISTARGNRSFWVRNLKQNPDVSYVLGGRSYSAVARVISSDSRAEDSLPRLLASLARLLAPFTSRGWAFAVLERA